MKKILVLFLLSALTVISCKKQEQQLASSGPTPILFKVTNQQKRANLRMADLFWYEHGVMFRENDQTDDLFKRPFHIHYPTTQSGAMDSLNPLLFTTGLVSISGRRNVDTFYISYGTMLVDTITVTVNKITENGNDAYRLNTIRQNGISLDLDTTIYNARNSDYKVFILR